ncbi:MAG: ATP-binding protein [Candidatus Gracilibacteria bacterium]|nr:ATP-binding protein [Candidatus Gracilibacteria bacterium]
MILSELEKYKEVQIEQAHFCTVEVQTKNGITGTLNLRLTNRGNKTKKEKIIRGINCFLYNEKPDERNKRYNWDTSSANILTISVSLDGISAGSNLSERSEQVKEEVSKITFSTESHIVTLIGPNGSGKSSLLLELFRKQIDEEDKSVIAFSSGQNERFSEIFEKHKKENKRFLKEANIEIDSFYFNKDWVRFLIFLSTALKEGRVRKYLIEHKYIVVEQSIDTSSFIEFDFRVTKKYLNILLNEFEREAKGEFLDKLIRETIYHRYLEKLIAHYINESYEFLDDPEEIKKQKVRIDASDFMEKMGKNINEIFTFLVHTTHGSNRNIDLLSTKLYFENGFEFKELSDGEYQLLGVYAILDLFDSESTWFLFDEIDSHLHYLNIRELWKGLREVKGKIVTTTHIPDSIVNNEIGNLRLVENLAIKDDKTIKSILDRLESISDKEVYEMKLLRKVKNLVVMDDWIDWLIFQKLVQKKLGDTAYEKIADLTFYKRSSSYNTTNEVFGKGKLLFVKDLLDVTNGDIIETQNIFLICDRDQLPFNQIKSDLQVNIDNEFQNIRGNRGIQTHLLSWRRLEIENYLLHKDLLSQNRCFPHLIYAVLNIDDCEDVRMFDVKLLLKALYKEPLFDETKLDELIERIPVGEISDDIEKMYNFISSKI